MAENRRATYADGHAVMYGKTDRPDFRGLEGYEDHDVGTLFFWNDAGKLIAMAVNVSCPSQEVEGDSNINADFWHPVRQSLRKRYGPDVCVLGWAGAAGDQSPHLMYRKQAEERMRALRKLTRPEELARRIVAAVDETFDAVQNDRHADVPLIHKVETLQLPMRLVTEAEYAQVKAAIAAEKPTQMRNRWQEQVLKRYERQKTDPHPVCGNGDSRAADWRRGHLHQYLRVIHRLWRTDEGPQPGGSNVRDPVGRRRRSVLLSAHGESRSRRRLQRDCAKQPDNAGRRADARRPDRCIDRFPMGEAD